MHTTERIAPRVDEWKLRVSGMHCNGCVQSVTQALSNLDGVESASVTLSPPQAVLTTSKPIDISTLNAVLEKVGDYRVSEWTGELPLFHVSLPVLESPAKKTPHVIDAEFWQDTAVWKRAALNTLNCLIGCSIGDFGFIIYAQAARLPWSMVAIMGVAMLCGLTTSVMLETVLLKLREKFDWTTALHTALSMSFLSMLAMELAENATDYFLTGGTAMPHEPYFWGALAASLAAGFAVPLPYNYFKLRKYNKACH